MKTCENCGCRVYSHGCVNCNEMDYISMQEGYKPDAPVTCKPEDLELIHRPLINIDLREAEQKGQDIIRLSDQILELIKNAEENVLIRVATELLGRPPVPEDFKRFAIATIEGKDYKQIAWDGKYIGRIEYQLPIGFIRSQEFRITFIPNT